MTAPNTTRPVRAVEHFHHLGDADRAHLFFANPQPLSLGAERDTVATALGATLYIPADRDDLAATVARRAGEGICSMVLDLEDAVDEANVETAALNAVNALDELAADGLAATAMVFVRVRSEACIERIVGKLSVGAQALAGFVVPKFSAATGERYLRQIAQAAETLGKHLYCMPVLESPQILYRESRDGELTAIADILSRYRDMVLAVRVGATDMCGMYGIRRDRDHTIYDVKTVADTIADIVNRLARNDGTGFVLPPRCGSTSPITNGCFARYCALHRSPSTMPCGFGPDWSAVTSMGCCVRSASTAPTGCSARRSSTPPTCPLCTRCRW